MMNQNFHLNKNKKIESLNESTLINNLKIVGEVAKTKYSDNYYFATDDNNNYYLLKIDKIIDLSEFLDCSNILK